MRRETSSRVEAARSDLSPLTGGQPVEIEHRIHGYRPRPALRYGSLVVRDEVDRRMPHRKVRLFWLLDHQVEMSYAPYGWDGEWRGDFVSITRSVDDGVERYHVEDLTLDFVVEGDGPTYRMIDLDELGDRLESGRHSAAEVAEGLRRSPRFLDAFLHRGAPWPPPAVRPFSPDHRYPEISA